MPIDFATPGNEPSRPQNFQVDLGGVVDLLSRHIYSGPRVYLRELLQNAVDAITARREQDGATGTDNGHIRIRPLTDGPDARTTLSLTDDGIGLTSAEATKLLHRLSDRGIIPPHTKVEVAIEERSVRALKPGSDQT